MFLHDLIRIIILRGQSIADNSVNISGKFFLIVNNIEIFQHQNYCAREK